MDRLPQDKGFPFRFGKISPSPYYLLPAVGEKIRSPIYLEDLRESVLGYDRPSTVCDDPRLQVAFLHVKRRFRLSKPVRVMPIVDILNGVPESKMYQRSPCLPWIHYGFKTKAEVYSDDRARESILSFQRDIQIGQDPKPSDVACFARSHLYNPSESHRKVRAVWGYPATSIAIEGQFAFPIIDAWRASPGPWAYGYETARGGHRRISCEAPPGYIHTLDFKSFDQSVSCQLIDMAFSVLEDNIDFTEYSDGSTADSMYTYNEWQWIQKNFKHCVIRLPNGERYRKHSGVPSGSFFTNMIDTIVNAIACHYTMLTTGSRVIYEKYLGDDSLLVCDTGVELEKISTTVAKLGLQLNIEKSCVSRTLSDHSFLGFGFTSEGLPTKPRSFWLSALQNPEREDKDIDDYRSRALGLLYANCGVDFELHRLLAREASGLKELKLPVNLERMFEQLGISEIEPEPPPPMELLMRTQY